MENYFITDEFKNMVALKAFGGEVITVMANQGDPGPTGRFPDGTRKNSTSAIFNLHPEDWEIGDTAGKIQNNSDMNGGLASTGSVTITHFSLWRQNGEYLGSIKLVRSMTTQPGDSVRISRGFIRYKFF